MVTLQEKAEMQEQVCKVLDISIKLTKLRTMELEISFLLNEEFKRLSDMINGMVAEEEDGRSTSPRRNR